MGKGKNGRDCVIKPRGLGDRWGNGERKKERRKNWEN